MPSKPRPKNLENRQHRDHPIRIVPLHIPKPVEAPATTEFTYRGGPLLANVEVFTVFWGDAWQAPGSSLPQQLNDFFDFILSSPLIDQLNEYSTPKFSIGRGQRTGTLNVSTPPDKTLEDRAIQLLIEQNINSGDLPKANPNTLYFLFLPEGVTVEQGGSASCQAFCGYHDSFGENIFYAVMPYPGCPGCTGGLSVLDALTSTSSHELCEAITDPIPGQGWYHDENGEIGDVCAWKTRKLGPYTIQLEWSNRAGACR
jgi:hypothetical protein